MIGLLFDRNVFKVLTLFSLSPGSKFKRNEIKEKILLNNVPLDKCLGIMVCAGILKKDRKIYSLNFESEYQQQIIGVVSKEYKYFREIPLKIYFLLYDFISEIKIDGELFLFGSYAKLIYKEGSDVDIAFVGNNPDKKQVNKIITKLEKKYDSVIEIHYFGKDEFYNCKKDPLVSDIMRNGVKIS